ncbi:MAG: hypothetical protein CMO74_12835 [Verrucomicrobiales bacterium]|nr:hypothetical protein [Verrucomicrobiales bacterium]|tara:strand:+ start:45538 stop:46575 length:1038 start_codon:yes stop_codon:yes gene_type:complete
MMLYIFPTIDVEGTHGREPFRQMLRGDVGLDEEWGVMLLARLFRKHGVSATFFVDVYEYTFHGEEPMKRVCNELLELGQDVQLHTHPSWRDDPCDFAAVRKMKRERSYRSQEQDFMAKLTRQQQVEVLSEGTNLLEKWTGVRPVAHRSGGYSINEDTVCALQEVGFRVDSSMNAAHGNSKLTWTRNQVVERGGVVELPVTVCNYTVGVRLGGRTFGCYRKMMKTDLEDLTLDEFHRFIRKAHEMDVRVLNLFMHSYSLLKFDYYYRDFQPSRENREKLNLMLEEMVGRDDVVWLSCTEFVQRYEEAPMDFNGSDEVPDILANRHVGWLAMRKLYFKYMDRLGRPE